MEVCFWYIVWIEWISPAIELPIWQSETESLEPENDLSDLSGDIFDIIDKITTLLFQ